MSKVSRWMAIVALLCAVCLTESTKIWASGSADQAAQQVEFAVGENKLTVVIGGLPVAMYSFEDDRTARPYFAHVRAPSGIQVTRHHPPIKGQDLTDHEILHPGIWLAFGDISGNDYWRLAAQVRHAEFVEEPKNGTAKGSFSIRNHYLDANDPSKVVCEEVARYTFHIRPAGYLLEWDSTFSSDDEFYFGDQEEMGLGIRVATPLRVEKAGKEDVPAGNGTILDAEGRRNEDEVWGNAAAWCDYSGEIAGQRVGITMLCHPDNFRPCWFHAREYGFMAANPFGRKAFGKGEKSKVVVKPGEKLRLRYGLLLHSTPEGAKLDLDGAYRDYVELTK